MSRRRPSPDQQVFAPSSYSQASRNSSQANCPIISASDTQALAHYVGKQIEVVGEVTLVDERQSTKGPYFFIDFGEWRQNCFRLVIWSNALHYFQQANIDLYSYEKQWLRVIGTLEQYRQSNGTTRLQIVVASSAAITKLANAQAAYDLLNAKPSPANAVQPPQSASKAQSTRIKSKRSMSCTAGTSTPPAGQSSTIVQGSTPISTSTKKSKESSAGKVARAQKERICAFCTKKQRASAKICSQCGIPLDPPTRFQPGKRLAKRYTIQRALTRGGMGEIYLALDTKLFNRVVVIKVMFDYFDIQNPKEVEDAKKMFEEEARTLSNLNYPAFPKIYDYFQQEADGCIVMESIVGENLEQRLTRQDLGGRIVAGQPYPLTQVVQWGIDICRSLEYLAAIAPNPVVHHDIKPANLLLDQNGLIRLVDFGTARPRAVTHLGNAVGQMTQIYGTPGYAPQEQYRGQTEPRSDIFALGATLYHLLTDDDPRNHPFTFPKLSQLGPLGKILQSALDNDVSKRPDATELRRSLEAFLAAEEERQRQYREDELRRQRDAAEEERRRLEAVLQREEQARKEAMAVAAQQAKIQAEQQARAEAERQALQAQLRAEAAERLKREEQLRRAPDGTLLLEPRDVVAWCERFWEQGVKWLRDHDRLAEQARFLWGEKLAMEIVSINRRNTSDGNAALDEVLALLDPQGFGAAKPNLQASGHIIEFGNLSADIVRQGVLMIKNASRRYERLTFQHPSWISMAEPQVCLTPGQEYRLVCFADGRAVTRDFQPQDIIKVFAGNTHLGTIRVRATLPMTLRLKLGLGGILRK